VRVIMITSEASPYAQTGGLGEVLSALSAELVEMGLEVDVFMPKYRSITPEKYPIRDTGLKIEVTLNAKPVQAGLWSLVDDRGVRFLFLDCDDYFNRENLYGTAEGDYEDNAERFVFLSRAAIELALANNVHYDVFHSHDWQGSLTPVYLRTLYAGEPTLDGSAAVMTIHNLGYQGIFWHLDMPLVGVGWEFFTPKHMEFHGKLNFLKSGIVFADLVNTVSPGYRNEILTSEYGFGLEGVLQEKGERLSGIINGVDYKIWNPEVDDLVAAKFGPDDLSGKLICKADLQRHAGLPVRPETPILGMVSRLSSQKGVDILAALLPSLMLREVQVALLGTGESRLQNMFQEFAEIYPDRIAVFLDYDYQLAHRIFAGSDILVVPSRYEPCGLTQLYALSYGTVPVVRMTGGLIDTVEEYDPETDAGTGFRFAAAEPAALETAINNALALYNEDKDSWSRLMIRGMKSDFSWRRSAQEYLRLYERALADRKSFTEDR
jgi:starch synthase